MKVINIVGARPNFMKIAPLVRAFAKHHSIVQRLVHTGQHYDPLLSDVFFRELGIPAPDVSLNVGSLPKDEQIAKISECFAPIVMAEKPDIVLVVGDVNSTIACAQTAKQFGVKVAHVEAGLRSFDLRMPEEHNRIATDIISDFLYVTEQSGMDNLAKEGVSGQAVLVGNCMIDTLIHDLPRAKASKKREELGLSAKGYIVATFHRPSNVDTPEALLALTETVEALCSQAPLVLPLHLRTKHALEKFGLSQRFFSIPKLIVTEPLGYIDFIGLVAASLAVVTDSGGIQEETTYLGVPCLTMRENTERPVTVMVGTNVLLGSDRVRLMQELDKIKVGSFKSGEIPPLWDGLAAERIATHLLGCFS